MRRILPVILAQLSLAAPALAQEVSLQPTAHPRPIGSYEGVEPGEAQPPPAYGRVGRRRSQILTWPGFRPMPDGSSRFFVQTTQPVQHEVRVEPNRVIVFFRHTSIHLRNSRRWLETRFFNTPVVRARLERRGRDMALVMHMRAGTAMAPRVSSEVAPGGNFHYVYIDFPPGQYAANVAIESVRPAGPPSAPARDIDPTLDDMDYEEPPDVEY